MFLRFFAFFLFFFPIFEQISQKSGNTWGETCVLGDFGQHFARGVAVFARGVAVFARVAAALGEQPAKNRRTSRAKWPFW